MVVMTLLSKYMRVSVGGETICIDTEDLHYLKEYSWHVGNIGGHKYVKRSMRDGEVVSTQYFHQLITGFKIVGFVNDNSLDCRKCNLYDKTGVV